MKIAFQHRKAPSTKWLTGMAVAAIGASTTLVLTPTKASAFDLGGIVGTAMALQQMGAFGLHGAPYGHSRSHVSSHHDSDSSAGNGGSERDAQDFSAMERSSKVATRQSFGPSGSTRQASERDASAGQTAAPDRLADDAPAYRPSR